jgi:hypothetical protein
MTAPPGQIHKEIRWPEPLHRAALARARYEERSLSGLIRWVMRQALEARAAAADEKEPALR